MYISVSPKGWYHDVPYPLVYVEKHSSATLIEHCWPNVTYHWCTCPLLIFILGKTLSIYPIHVDVHVHKVPYTSIYSLYVHVCVYIQYTSIYPLRVHVHVCIYVHVTHIFMYMYVYMYMLHIHSCTCTCYTYIRVHVHVTHIFMYMYAQQNIRWHLESILLIKCISPSEEQKSDPHSSDNKDWWFQPGPPHTL